jgi:hypothetical protein
MSEYSTDCFGSQWKKPGALSVPGFFRVAAKKWAGSGGVFAGRQKTGTGRCWSEGDPIESFIRKKFN